MNIKHHTMRNGFVNKFFSIDKTKAYGMLGVMTKVERKNSVAETVKSHWTINCLDIDRIDYSISQNIGGHMDKEGASKGNCGAKRGTCGGCGSCNKEANSAVGGNEIFSVIERVKFSVTVKHCCSKNGNGCCGNCNKTVNENSSANEKTNEVEKC